MKEIKVVIIGAGNMAREHIKAFNAISNATVVGIYSRTLPKAESLAKEFTIPIVANSVDELFEKTQADLVVVTVPELQANKIAKECFKLNWTVLLEKPAGFDLLDASDIAEAALQSKKPVFVGFNRRFYSSALSILQDLDSRPQENRYIHIQDQQSFAEARAYHHPEEVVEKFMYANSIHTIDLIRYFGRGDIKQITPVTPWEGERTEIMLAHIQFESGDMGLYEGIWKGPGPWTCSISTPSRRWSMQPLETARYQNLNERVLHEIEINPIDKQYKAGFYLQAQEICKAIEGKENKAVTISDSLNTMQLIHGIFKV